MDIHDDHVPDDLFSQFTEHMPECCVELVVEHDGGVLLVRRTNPPAEGEWFWPGGRLYKGETLDHAAHRVAREELGIDVDLYDRLGVYAHFWESSAVKDTPSRHTVNVVYRARPIDGDPTITLDDQHDDYRILRKPDDDLHEYVQRYVEDGALLGSAGASGG